MNRVTPWEARMEAHSDTDVQIVQLIIKQWARGTNRTGGVAASSLVFLQFNTIYAQCQTALAGSSIQHIR